MFCVVRLMLSWSRHACWLLAFHCRVRQVKVWGALMSCCATSMNDEYTACRAKFFTLSIKDMALTHDDECQ